MLGLDKFIIWSGISSKVQSEAMVMTEWHSGAKHAFAKACSMFLPHTESKGRELGRMLLDFLFLVSFLCLLLLLFLRWMVLFKWIRVCRPGEGQLARFSNPFVVAFISLFYFFWSQHRKSKKLPSIFIVNGSKVWCGNARMFMTWWRHITGWPLVRGRIPDSHIVRIFTETYFRVSSHTIWYTEWITTCVRSSMQMHFFMGWCMYGVLPIYAMRTWSNGCKEIWTT